MSARIYLPMPGGGNKLFVISRLAVNKPFNAVKVVRSGRFIIGEGKKKGLTSIGFPYQIGSRTYTGITSWTREFAACMHKLGRLTDDEFEFIYDRCLYEQGKRTCRSNEFTLEAAADYFGIKLTKAQQAKVDKKLKHFGLH